MPYILPEARERIRRLIDILPVGNEGEANYAITYLLHRFIGFQHRYSDINAAIGVLECAKLELYRMVAQPYEDGKRKLNGKVLLEADDV